jgi:thioredoxin-like negative regulator of GroEL
MDPSRNSLVGKVFPVSWDAALALRDLCTEFFLIIVDEGSISTQLERTLVSFISHYNLQLYVVKVSIVDFPEAPSRLGIAYLPQTRYYKNGIEVNRHRGMATYDALRALAKVNE